MFAPRHYGSYRRDTTRGMDAIERSDMVAMELMQHRHRQESSEMHGGETLMATTKSEFWPGPLVMGDILALVKHLVQYGGRCTQYQDAVFQGTGLPQRTYKAVEDLTFASSRRSFGSLWLWTKAIISRSFRTSGPRELDAVCEAYLPQAGTAPLTVREPIGEEVADRISPQIRDTITTQLTGMGAGILDGIKTQVSDLVADEMGRL
ncbi:hypothetical protein GE09DRAFT_1260759 [Coniochaeta sp. 2T2.1]|nr:hypothetical protein GE09DRAFT_1260759 [Coniochaeta sp. 2T2.1]